MSATIKITFTKNKYYFSAQVQTDTLGTFLEHIDDLLARLEEAGCEPADYSNGTNSTNTKPSTAPICPEHNTPMKQSKWGGWYCAKRNADGSFCKHTIKAA